MNIALSLLSGVRYGGVTYFENLIPKLVEEGRAHTFHFFVSHGHPLMERVTSSRAVFHEVLGQNTSGLKRFLFEQVALPWKLKQLHIDIVYTAKNINVLFAPCKTVTAIRNVEPFVYAHYRNHWRLNILSKMKWMMTALSVRKADRIVAVSRGVKERVVERFPDAEGKTVVIYNGNPVTQAPQPAARQNFLLSASKFVAYANQLNLIHGYARLCERRLDVPPLKLAGGVHDKAYFESVQRAVRDHGLQKQIEFLGLVPQKDLFELYAQARAFVFPSTLEACPHTLIEVMACGTPVCTTTHQPMPEICKDGAVYVEAFDPKSIADGLEKVLFDEDVRTRITRAALERQKDFDWTKAARQLIQLFDRMV